MHSVRIEETTDGWRLLFRAANDLALLPSVANWIALERRCCPFPHFRVVLTPTALWLELGGPVGVKSFRI